MTAGTGQATESPRVLVVDDFKDGRELAQAILAHAGFTVHVAGTGPDGLDMARELLPAVLVLDLALPGLDGWEIARLLKSDGATRPIRILALTAHAERRAIRRAMAAGCDAVVTKPCLPDQLVAEVRRLLGAGVAATPHEEN